jgi:hypothetical protein
VNAEVVFPCFREKNNDHFSFLLTL